MSAVFTSRLGAVGALVVAVLAVGAVFYFPPTRRADLDSLAARPAFVDPTPKNILLPASAASPNNVYIGRDEGTARTIQSIFTTRKKEVLYQALIRFAPRQAGWKDVSGIGDVQQYYASRDKILPQTLLRFDQETEMASDNLGEPLRFVTSLRMYVNPADGHAIAYDMAQTAGGQPQRMVGHVTSQGVTLEIYRGGQFVDRQEIGFSKETFIPVDFDFIHQWYENSEHAEAKRKGEPIKFSTFIPEAMALVLLVVHPLPDQVIPIGDANYDCAHYDVLTYSTQSSEGLFARQEMWFDRKLGRMMKRQDFDASLEPTDAPVTEREPYQRVEQLRRLSPLPIEAPKLPERGIDNLLDQDLDYKISAHDVAIGTLSIRFSKSKDSTPPFMPVHSGNPVYQSVASVNVETKGSLRNETAVTLYDAKWHPLSYETRGEESAGTKLKYDVLARIDGSRLAVSAHRDIVPELKYSTLRTGAVTGYDAGVHDVAVSDANWHDPLKRVPVSDEDARAEENPETPRLIDQSWTRTFPEGLFISDYSRIEHLALLARRLPLPAVDAKEYVKFPRAALYLIRQNRCGVLLFEVRPEAKPRLTERQKRRLTPEELNEPPLFAASASAAMMPSRMLLSPEGRILQLNMRYGAGDVTYTLDDPIMRHRAERSRAQKLQEGPRLLRPPWW